VFACSAYVDFGLMTGAGPELASALPDPQKWRNNSSASSNSLIKRSQGKWLIQKGLPHLDPLTFTGSTSSTPKRINPTNFSLSRRKEFSWIVNEEIMGVCKIVGVSPAQAGYCFKVSLEQLVVIAVELTSCLFQSRQDWAFVGRSAGDRQARRVPQKRMHKHQQKAGPVSFRARQRWLIQRKEICKCTFIACVYLPS